MTHHHHRAVGATNNINPNGNNAFARRLRAEEFSGKDVYDFAVKAMYYSSDLEELLFAQGEVVPGQGLHETRDWYTNLHVNAIRQERFAGEQDIIRNTAATVDYKTVTFVDGSILQVTSKQKPSF